MPLAEWVEPLHLTAWGHEVWTVPPPSQGYLTLAAAWIADGLDLPTDPDDAGVGAPPRRGGPPGGLRPARGAPRGRRRPGPPAPRPACCRDERPSTPRRRGAVGSPSAGGDTIYLCAVDAAGMGVSLIQSNAAGWGCHLVVPGTGVFLHNRGIGFSLEAGHPAELAPGRRPPHTLAPALVTRDGALHAVLGTMGGDTQPQVVLQLLARLLHAGQSPGTAIRSPRGRWATGGFDVWEHDDPTTTIEWDAPASWERGLADRGHRVERAPQGANLGHAHVIVRAPDGMLAGAADPRALSGAAIGW